MAVAYNILILTDHAVHSSENSIYALASALYQHPKVQMLDIASRGTSGNAAFFGGEVESELSVINVKDELDYEDTKEMLDTAEIQAIIHDYDFVILRLPPPLSEDFLYALTNTFDERCIVNRPRGILEAGSKEYLLKFPELCPPIKLIDSIDRLKAFASRFPIVLKPLRSYSGQGILRVVDGMVESGDVTYSLEDFIQKWKGSTPYLGMQFLRNVEQGDKRIVVCNGQILGASLRLPKPGSWMCNIGQGGSSTIAYVTDEEYYMAQVLYKPLKEMGVIFFGFDTLVGDDGKRALSEINAASIGGLKAIELQQGIQIMSRIADLIIEYIDNTLSITDFVSD